MSIFKYVNLYDSMLKCSLFYLINRGCITHLKLVAAVAAKFVGSDAIIKGLNEVNLDGAKILEGIQM